MSKASDYELKTEGIVAPIVADNSFELVDVEYVKEAGNYFLRVYIDKPGGITIDDCEVVSRALSEKLDEDDFIDDAYILEVSSPGLDRPLKKDKDFDRHKGDDVEVKLYKAVSKKEAEEKPELKELVGYKELIGVLEDYDAMSVSIKINEDTICKFDRKEIAQVRLAFDF